MAHRLIPSLPRVKVPIGHIPQRLRSQLFENPRGRLEVLRRLVNQMVREERVEFKYNKAVECRQYIERLCQMGVLRGINDSYTKEMFDWWFIEADVYEKMVDEIIPRFKTVQEPYTKIYTLPKIRLPLRINVDTIYWTQWDIAVLELKGNPFPSMQYLEESRQLRMKQIVKNAIEKNL